MAHLDVSTVVLVGVAAIDQDEASLELLLGHLAEQHLEDLARYAPERRARHLRTLDSSQKVALKVTQAGLC